MGFTLLELLVVITIIGVLASIAIPTYNSMRDRAKVGRTATELRNFATAFFAFAMANGEFPEDNHEELPPGMEAFISPAVFNRTTPIGGRYNWEGPDNYPYAGVSISGSIDDPDLIAVLDNVMDDGDPNTGRLRVGSNGRPTFIIEEQS